MPGRLFGQRCVAWAVAALVCLGGWGGSPLGAQSEDPPPDRTNSFGETVDVNLVNIEVTAFDQEGRAVLGLTRDDFEVMEDGEPVEITHFYPVADGIRFLEPLDPGAPSRPVNLEAPSARDRRFVVLYVDNGNILPVNRRRVFQQLRRSMDALLSAADEIMVVSQNSGVVVEQTFTRDVELIDAALARSEKVAGRGAARFAEPRVIQREIESGEAPPGADVLVAGSAPVTGEAFSRPNWDVDARRTYSRVSSFAETTRHELRQTIGALIRCLDSLSGLPGRKALLYVSDGLELNPGEALFRIWDYKYSTIASEEVGVASIDLEIDRYNLRSEYRDLVRAANANRVAFYTIQGGSSRTFGSVSAQGRTLVADTLARSADGGKEDSLRDLASQTGGRALVNSSGVAQFLESLKNDFSHYYSLGFPSLFKGDSKYHQVKVRVRKEGVKLRYISGYRDKSPQERMVDRTLASLLHNVGENPLDIQVDVGEHDSAGGRKGFLVPLSVKVPLSKIALLPQAEEHMGRVSVFIAVQDSKGRMSDPQTIELPLRIPNDQLLAAISQTAEYRAQLQMRAGPQKLAVGVWDEVAAVGSTMNLQLHLEAR